MGIKIKKKIGFIISRKNYLKFLGYFIYENLDKNDVYIFCDQRASKDNFKWRDLPDLELFKRFQNVKIISFANNEALKTAIVSNDIQEIFSLQPKNYFEFNEKMEFNNYWSYSDWNNRNWN